VADPAVTGRAGDLRLLLPGPVRSARRIGEAAGPAAGLADALADFPDADADVVVAPASAASVAAASQAPHLVLAGRAPASALRAAGYQQVQYVLALEGNGALRLTVPLDSQRALSAAFDAVAPRRDLPAELRRRAARLALRSGRAPGRSTVTLASRRPGPSVLMAAVGAAGVPAGRDWYLWSGTGPQGGRGVLHVLAPGSPGWAVKFSRSPDGRADNDGAGIAMLPPDDELLAHVPQQLAHATCGDLPVSVERRAPGRPLFELLSSGWPRARREALVDDVCRWLLLLARSTAQPATALAAERLRLADLPRLPEAQRGAARAALRALPDVVAVSEHGDPGTNNVVSDGPGRFQVVDWERAHPQGLPLADLLYFLVDACLALDGTPYGPERTPAALALVRGAHRFSPLLSRWVRTGGADLGLPPTAIGPLALLCWLGHASKARPEKDPDVARYDLRLDLAHAWTTEPDLGPGWAPA